MRSMGLLRHHDDQPTRPRYRMRERLMAVGDDFWIEDDAGDRVYKVDGKALRLRETFVLEDRDGDEICRIQERKLSLRDKVAVERHGTTVATVHKALVGIRDRFDIDLAGGGELKARGNVLDHEYEIRRDGEAVAWISKRWFRVRDSYGIEVADGEDVPIVLAVAVAIDALTRG
jgi:uncharacterized protein YxjI